jgi:hypothetical protein
VRGNGGNLEITDRKELGSRMDQTLGCSEKVTTTARIRPYALNLLLYWALFASGVVEWVSDFFLSLQK